MKQKALRTLRNIFVFVRYTNYHRMMLQGERWMNPFGICKEVTVSEVGLQLGIRYGVSRGNTLGNIFINDLHAEIHQRWR